MLPVQRQTRTQSKKRRSHDALKAAQVVRCPNCGSAKRPHTACGECGYVRPGLKLRVGKNDEA
jgi:large subunit ribosomal protein L32